MGTKTHLEVLGNFTNETLEGELADEQLGRLLVAPNFTEGDGSRAEPVRLLDTTGGLWRDDVSMPISGDGGQH